MTERSRHRADALSLIESFLDERSPTEPGAIRQMAELTARCADEPSMSGGTVPPELLAAYLDGGIDVGERERVAAALAASPADLLDAMASLVLVEEVEAVPDEYFLPLAAASGEANAVLCRSQSGLWTLEVFAETAVAENGHLLLSVHPDHRATYEGRMARIFVRSGESERVLAEATVRDGEIYAPVSLAGLDLRRRDAVSVTFGPARPPS